MPTKPTTSPKHTLGRKKLTPKQEKFAQVYIETGNASEAYRQAYNAGNMKREGLSVNASKLLSSVKVALRVEELQAAHRERHSATVDNVVLELTKIAFFDFGSLFGRDGQLLPMHELPEDARRVLVSIDVISSTSETGAMLSKVRVLDKLKALELLGRKLGIFNDKLALGEDKNNPLPTNITIKWDGNDP